MFITYHGLTTFPLSRPLCLRNYPMWPYAKLAYLLAYLPHGTPIILRLMVYLVYIHMPINTLTILSMHSGEEGAPVPKLSAPTSDLGPSCTHVI